MKLRFPIWARALVFFTIIFVLIVFASVIPMQLIAQNADADLEIGPSDIRIEQRVDGGFHLFIRKKPGISSVLLTESTRDPAMKADSYAYRAADWNKYNGDEKRLLNGAPLSPGIHSLIDSSPESDSQFGEAFHIYIPYILYYGYEGERHGEVYVVDGTYLNIRAFALPYADYRGAYRDNPFELKVTQKPLEGPPEGNYMDDTVKAYEKIAETGHGELIYALGPEDLVDKIRRALEPSLGKTTDIVLCLDTTGSMKNDINEVRKSLIPMLHDMVEGFASFRIGMVLYKDYYEDYLTRVIPFTDDFAKFQKQLDGIRVNGGRDIPEAVYEALYDGAVKFKWEAEERVMILIGDAPPHPRPRGRITKEMVDAAVDERGIRVNAIILPQ